MGAPRDAVRSLRIGCLAGCGGGTGGRRRSAAELRRGVTACGFAEADLTALGARNRSGSREGA